MIIRLLYYLDGHTGLLTLNRLLWAITAGVSFVVLVIFALGVAAGWLLF